MVEQLTYSDGAPLRILRQQRADGVVEVEGAALDEPHDGGGGELLGDAADAVDGRSRRRKMAFAVPLADSREIQRVGAAHDADRRAHGGSVGEEAVRERVETADEIITLRQRAHRLRAKRPGQEEREEGTADEAH